MSRRDYIDDRDEQADMRDAAIEREEKRAAEAANEIHFYAANEKPYGVLSNLYRCPVIFEGRVFQTSEHAYQFGKARKPEVQEWLMSAPSPSLLAMAAHGLYHWDIAPGWSKRRFPRMADCMLAKFQQNEAPLAVLLGTGTKRLVEYTSTDNPTNRRWGEVAGVGGQNWCGRLLMWTRYQLGGAPFDSPLEDRP